MLECDAGFFLRSSLDINTAELCSNKSRKNTANWFKDLLTHTDRNQFHKVWKPVEINLRVRWFERFMKEKERYNASVYRLQNSTQMMSFSKSSRSSSLPPVHSELSPSKITKDLVLIRKSPSFSNLFGPPQAPKNYKIQLVYWPATTSHAFIANIELRTQKWTSIVFFGNRVRNFRIGCIRKFRTDFFKIPLNSEISEFISEKRYGEDSDFAYPL